MEEKLKQLAGQIAGFWKSLSLKKRISIIAAFVGVAMAVTLFVLVSTRVSYSPLYLGLDASEAGEILDKVQSMGVPVKVNGTGNIYVDSKKADTVKMKLAEEGYPKSTLSYDIFMSGTNWAMTDSDKKKLALYQLQDRLQDTIKTIPGVENADITIGQGNNDSYVLSTDNTPVTASVKLNLSTGYTLTKEQVQGIALLVSKSVPDLSESNVAILDSDGTSLIGADSDDSYSSSRLELQQKVEDMIQQKVLSVLEPVYGKGNVRAAAGATINFDQTQTDKTEYQPTSNGLGVPQSTSKTITYNGGVNGGASGVAGVTGTAQYAAAASSAANAASGNVTNEQTNYLVNTVNQQIKDSGGNVSKLTVAVVLDSKTGVNGTADVNSIKQTVAYSVGIDPAEVSVQIAPFAAASAAQPAAQKNALSTMALMVAAGALALAVIAAAVIIFVMMRKKSAARLAAETQVTQEIVAQQQEENEDVQSIDEYMKDAEKNTTKKKIEDFSEDKPDMVAQLLRNWLKD